MRKAQNKANKEKQEKYMHLMEAYKKGNTFEREKILLIILNDLDKWIQQLARHYHTYSSHFEDLLQEGKLAVINNIDKYDASKQLPITYFTKYIHGAMFDYIARQSGKKRNDYTNLNKITKAIAKLEEDGVPITLENIERYTDDRITKEVIWKNQQIHQATSDQVSLDKPTEGDYNILDGFSANTETPEDIFLRQEKIDVVAQALKCLTPEERYVVGALFLKEKTVNTTVAEMGLTQSQVKKIRTNALIKLQSNANLLTYLGITPASGMMDEYRFVEDDADLSLDDYDVIDLDVTVNNIFLL